MTGPPTNPCLPSIDLTPRQRQVAQLVQARLTNVEIARQLKISVHTVRAHLKAAVSKGFDPSRRRLHCCEGSAQPPLLSGEEARLVLALLHPTMVEQLARLLELTAPACRRLVESILLKVTQAKGELEVATPGAVRPPSMQAAP